jgi:hypothetical protein
MAIHSTPVSAEAFHPYPDSADNTPYDTTGDAGNFFSTLLDIINPLQHIPLVSNIYREFTGDEIEPAARLVGGAVFGGPIGFASTTANVLIEQASTQTPTETPETGDRRGRSRLSDNRDRGYRLARAAVTTRPCAIG